MIGPQKLLDHKNYWTTKIIGPQKWLNHKIGWTTKTIEPKKWLNHKNGWTKKTIEPQKRLDHKKRLDNVNVSTAKMFWPQKRSKFRLRIVLRSSRARLLSPPRYKYSRWVSAPSPLFPPEFAKSARNVSPPPFHDDFTLVATRSQVQAAREGAQHRERPRRFSLSLFLAHPLHSLVKEARTLNAGQMHATFRFSKSFIQTPTHLWPSPRKTLIAMD